MDKEEHSKALEKIAGLSSVKEEQIPLPPQSAAAPIKKDPAPVRGLGRIIAVQGPVVDVYFENHIDIPALYDVIEAHTFDKRRIILQCAEHLNTNVVRCMSLMDTLNLQLNSPCYNTFEPISIPTGDECFGRVMDATGQPLDNGGKIKTVLMTPIKKMMKQVGFDLKSKKGKKPEVLETGMKYVDLLFPLVPG